MKKIIACLLAVLVMSALGFSRESEDFDEKKSDHFIIYYAGKDVPLEFVDTIIEFSEKYYGELTQKLGFTRFDYWTWDKRAKIYVYADQELYLKKTSQPGWSGGAADYLGKTIWTFPREAGFFDSTLPHEIGHIIFREAIGDRYVPLWVEEGVAQYMEQAKRLGSEKTVLDAISNDTFISLEKLSLIDGNTLRQYGDVSLFYAESVNVVTFLIEKFGAYAFSSFCNKIKDGKSMDDALGSAYFDVRDVHGLSQLWENSLRDKIKDRTKSKMML
jgi:hypothetical protein